MIQEFVQIGGVAEWLKAAVLKTVECQSSVGSNPTSSARTSSKRRNGRVAEGARLLSEYGVNAPSRVRIPLSPPQTNNTGVESFLFQLPFFVSFHSTTEWLFAYPKYRFRMADNWEMVNGFSILAVKPKVPGSAMAVSSE